MNKHSAIVVIHDKDLMRIARRGKNTRIHRTAENASFSEDLPGAFNTQVSFNGNLVALGDIHTAITAGTGTVYVHQIRVSQHAADIKRKRYGPIRRADHTRQNGRYAAARTETQSSDPARRPAQIGLPVQRDAIEDGFENVSVLIRGKYGVGKRKRTAHGFPSAPR